MNRHGIERYSTPIPKLNAPTSLYELKHRFEEADFNDYLTVVIDDAYRTAASQSRPDQATLFQKQITQTKLAVWKQFIEHIGKLKEDLQSIFRDKDNDTFIVMLIRGIGIMDDDIVGITTKIDETVTYIQTYKNITLTGMFRPIVAWYIESKLKKMGILIEQTNNYSIQSAEAFSTFYRKNQVLYIVHDDTMLKRRNRINAIYTESKHNTPEHTMPVMVKLTSDPYKPLVCANSDTFFPGIGDTTTTHAHGVSNTFYVTGFDPNYNYSAYGSGRTKNKNDINGFNTFVRHVYSQIYPIHHQDDNADAIVPVLFIHGNGVNSCVNASAVLFLFANCFSLGVPMSVYINPLRTLIDEGVKFFEKNPSSQGGKKRSSKKTYRARIKSNNRNKYRSRRSRTKYHKKTARKA